MLIKTKDARQKGLASLFFVLLWVCCTAFLLGFGANAAYAAEHKEAYTVQKGDTFRKIANRYGVEADLIAAMNNMDPQDALKVGAQIYLPLEPQTAVVVRSGDTLWSISREYGVDLSVLISYNSVLDPRKMRCGDTVYLPVNNEEGIRTIGVADVKLASRSISKSNVSSSFQKPLSGIITQKFNGVSHHGLDIAAPKGTPIAAAKSGKVTFAGWKSGVYGNVVVIQHHDNTSSFYAHVAKISVKVDQTVKAGETIATVGLTGRTTGPHLHLELYIGERLVDPQDYLNY